MRLELGVPRILLRGFVSAGAGINTGNAVAAGYGFLLLGMDAYPGVQPNNGDLIVTITEAGPGGDSFTLWQIQQSQNFPGPFYWRGFYPIYDNEGTVSVSSTVPFAVNLWGFQVPRWLSDSNMQF